jgi:sec-independent protein translocase protein TatC
MSHKDMPLRDHIDDLRKRVLFSIGGMAIFSAICYVFYTPIAAFFMAPFSGVYNHGGQLNVNSIYEGFFVKIKLSVISGCIFSLPMTLFQIGRFIFPGLKAHEKKWVFIILISSSILSIGSTYLGYAIVFPYIVTFLLNTQFIPENIHVLLNYKQNLGYIISFLTGSIIIFQSPILLSLLLAKNIVTRSFLWANSRWFILGIVIASAMVTPPDIFSQLMLSGPLIACYFGCIILAKIMKWGRSCSE